NGAAETTAAVTRLESRAARMGRRRLPPPRGGRRDLPVLASPFHAPVEGRARNRRCTRMSLVPVLTCSSVEEAATYRGGLEAHGVPCVVQGEHPRALLGMLGPYVEVRLLVPADQESTARGLLRPAPSLVVDEELAPDPRRARKRRLLGWIALAVL